MVPPVVLLQVTGKQTVLYGELEKRNKRKRNNSNLATELDNRLTGGT